MEILRIQELAKLVRSERERQGLTQLELARNAAVSRRWLIGLEQGEIGDARLSTLLKVTQELGIRLTANAQSRANTLETMRSEPEGEYGAIRGQVAQRASASAMGQPPLFGALLARKNEVAGNRELSEAATGALDRLAKFEQFRNLTRANQLSQESAMQHSGAFDEVRRKAIGSAPPEEDGE